MEFIHENSRQISELQSSLPIAYARLSLLERTAGNEAQSQIYYEKARYWSMVGRERLGMTPEEIVADQQAFTREESDGMALGRVFKIENVRIGFASIASRRGVLS